MRLYQTQGRDSLQNKRINSECGSVCSYRRAGDKEVIRDSGRTMHCKISALTVSAEVNVVTSRQAVGGRQQTADSRQQVVGKQ